MNTKLESQPFGGCTGEPALPASAGRLRQDLRHIDAYDCVNGLYDWIDRPDELPESISIGYDFPGVGPGSWFDNPFRGWYVFDGAFVRRALRCVPCTRPRRNP